jgi:hypothetical protein
MSLSNLVKICSLEKNRINAITPVRQIKRKLAWWLLGDASSLLL